MKDKRLLTLALAATAGLAHIAIFPRLGCSWLAYVCLVPLFLILPAENEPPISGRLYYLAGVLFHFGNLYWIYHVIQHYTALKPMYCAGILALLCLMLAVFWAFCGWILGKTAARFGVEKTLWLAPFLWVALEWGKNWMQFPWCLLGYSQVPNLRVSQLASVAGVYGLSWLIVAVNAGVALVIIRRKQYYLYSTVFILAAVILVGHFRIARPVSGEWLTVGCIQGNVAQDVKLDYEFADQVNKKHIQMTRELLARAKPDVIFWSEASTLYPLRAGGEWTRQVQSLVRETRVPLVVGSDSFDKTERIYNSAFLIGPDGEIENLQYSKIYLVPFGEFVPFSSILFFAGKVVPEISDFTAGNSYTEFPLNKEKFAVNICFEVVFPQLSRRLVQGGAGLLTTITNDAWFGNTSSPYQHLEMAVMRSIENRRYLVRTANTGVSAIVDPYGRILQQTGIYVPAIMTGKVQWIHEQTFYTKHGDVIVWISLVVSFACIVILVVHRKSKEV